MADLWAHVLPLALGAAVSPTVLAVNLIVLGSPRRPRSRGAGFALGGAVVIAVLSIVALAGLLPTTTSSGASTTGAAVDLVCAVVLVLLAIRALRRPAPAARQPADGPWLGYVGLGAAVMATNFTTIVLYVPAMKDIARADVPGTTQAAAVVVTMAITTVTLWVPLVLTLLAPGVAGRVLGGLDGFLTAHQRAVTVVICFGFAVLLAVKGIARL